MKRKITAKQYREGLIGMLERIRISYMDEQEKAFDELLEIVKDYRKDDIERTLIYSYDSCSSEGSISGIAASSIPELIRKLADTDDASEVKKYMRREAHWVGFCYGRKIRTASMKAYFEDMISVGAITVEERISQ